MEKKPLRRKPDHDLLIRIDERQEAQMQLLQSILEEAKKTNGRIKSLEMLQPTIDQRLQKAEAYFPDIVNFKEFTSRWTGAWKASSIIGAIIGALVTFIGSILMK